MSISTGSKRSTKPWGITRPEQILIQAARRLSGTVRETDTVARVGRDEFVIIQTLTEQPADAAALADRIVAEMALPFSVDGQPIVVTASVGVALYPADGSRAPGTDQERRAGGAPGEA